MQGDNGTAVDHVAFASGEGDLARIVTEANSLFRRKYPLAEPFRKTIRIERLNDD